MPVPAQLCDGVGEKRGPVPVPDRDGAGTAASLQFRSQRIAERLVLFIDGGAAAEQLVVLRDLKQPLIWHTTPRGCVAHER